MPNDINKPTTDHLSEAFRTQLENHQMPVDADMWDAIESKLATQTKPQKRISPLWWYSIVTAAAVALLFVFNIPSVIDQPIQVAQQLASPIQNTQPTANSTNSTQKTVANNQNTRPTTLINNTKSTTNIQQNLLAENKQQVSLDTLETIENPAVNSTSADTLSQQSLVDDRLAQTEMNSNTPKLELKPNDWTDPLDKKKSKKGWELIAMAGSSGNASPNSSGNTNVFADLTESYFNYINPELEPAGPAKTNQLPLNSYNQKNHFAPITAGIAIAYNLSPTLSIETGLSYSYLLSTYQNTATNSDASSHLHYLGLPLRLSYNYLKTNKWKFYVSAGTMIEKGLSQLQIENQRYNNQTFTTRNTNNIDGVQWSLQASTGVSYSLFKNTSLYIEPKVAWYFDNNQPTSIRTENNLTIGFEAGLRFHIN